MTFLSQGEVDFAAQVWDQESTHYLAKAKQYDSSDLKKTGRIALDRDHVLTLFVAAHQEWKESWKAVRRLRKHGLDGEVTPIIGRAHLCWKLARKLTSFL